MVAYYLIRQEQAQERLDELIKKNMENNRPTPIIEQWAILNG